MSKSSDYKRLGDYIREVDVRNRDLAVTQLIGLTIDKAFIPSVANVIGTDLSNYKVIRNKQFACSLMQVSRDQRIPIAIFKGTKAIMSPAYPMFEVIDEQKLLPEYLMMWFARKEFDREASFYAVGGVRGSLTWNDFTNMTLPIPSIDRQRAIVAEYETLTRRINLNRSIITQLETTAQTLYRKMFVDDIDPENLPAGWRMGTLGEICEINTDNISAKEKYDLIQYLDSSSVVQNSFEKYQTLKVGIDEIPSRAKRKVRPNDIVYSMVRPNLKHHGIVKGDIYNLVVSTGFTVLRSNYTVVTNYLLYLMLTEDKNTELLQGIAETSKATYPSITSEDIQNINIIIPSLSDQVCNINRFLQYCFDSIYYNHQENRVIKNMQSLLLAKMGQNDTK